MTVAANKIRGASAALDGTGTIAATASKRAYTSATFSATGTLTTFQWWADDGTARGYGTRFYGANAYGTTRPNTINSDGASLTGTGTFAAEANKISRASATFTGTGTFVGEGYRVNIVFITGTLTGVATLSMEANLLWEKPSGDTDVWTDASPDTDVWAAVSSDTDTWSDVNPDTDAWTDVTEDVDAWTEVTVS